MRTQSLNGTWKVRQCDGGPWRDASVPGGVYRDLRDAGAIPDPTVADDEREVQWVGEADWEYRRTFDVDPALLDEDRILLEFDGIDTVATVFVDGTEVGSSRNMHVRHAFDVTDVIEAGRTQVTVRFRSPVEYAAERADAHPYEVPSLRFPVDHPGRSFVRKAQCHFGWDWGPCLPTMGIYRSVDLVAFSGARVRHVTTEQDHEGSNVALTAEACVETTRSGEVTVTATVAGARAREMRTVPAGRTTIRLELDPDDVDRWWPAGQGDQPLYDLTVGAAMDGREYRHTDRVGFRDVELVTEPDGDGSSFRFEVNGRPVFAKGANVVPTSPFHGPSEGLTDDELVAAAAAADMNMLRVWGGGYYRDESFYDRCDEQGILVWQDLMFACALYPSDDAFRETVDREIRDQARRLGTHPSLALWCGNNECEVMLREWADDHPAHDDHCDDYSTLFEEVVPRACREEDPDTPYWPGSPSSGPADGDRDETVNSPGSPRDQNDSDAGDAHRWEVWHDGQPIEWYRTVEPRFVSEFGYQSFPSADALERAVGADQLNPTAPLVEYRQRDPGGTRTCRADLGDRFRIPAGYDDFAYLTQLQQGVAMGAAIEHWRRTEETAGALYWQLNATWTAPTWASLEHDGQWKAQQYMARRQFAPLLPSFAPRHGGYGTDDDGRQHWAPPESQTLVVTNDRPDAVTGTVRLEVIDVGEGSVVHAEPFAVDLEPRETRRLVSVGRSDLPPDLPPSRVMLRATVDDPDAFPAFSFLERYKGLKLPEADPVVTTEGGDVVVETDDAALFVALDDGALDGVLSDSYFHLPPGGRRTLQVTRVDAADGGQPPEPDGPPAVRHLRETY